VGSNCLVARRGQHRFGRGEVALKIDRLH
jgi:hypothetical protein